MKLSKQIATQITMDTLVNMLAELMLYQATNNTSKSEKQFVADVWAIGAQRAKQTGQNWQEIMDRKFEQLRQFQD